MNKKVANYKQRYLELVNNEKFSRLGRNFKTSNYKYFYDTGTGKVFQIDDNLDAVIAAFF